MDYAEISIRITLPDDVNAVLTKEKDRFVSEYGSTLRSAPHITLYLARYTEDGFPKLMADLKELTLESTSFLLLELKVTEGTYNNSYVVDVSNYEQLTELHNKVSEVASRYQSPLLREKDQKRLEKGIPLEVGPYIPHISLGNIPIDDPQPKLEEVQENIKSIVGKHIDVSSMTVFFYGRKKGEEKITIVEEVKIDF